MATSNETSSTVRGHWLPGLVSAVALGIAMLALVRSGDVAPIAAVLAWIAGTALAMWLLRSGADRPASLQAPVRQSESAPAAAPVIGALPGPTLLIGPADTVTACNQMAIELVSGLKPGAPVSAAMRHPDLLAAIRQARASGAVQRLQYEERVPLERRIEATVAPVAGASGHYIIALRDLTEEARVEQMRADFVANASHELRTPLASLQGFIETLQGPARDDPAAREKFLGIMASQASRMTRLIDDLMSLSRIEMHEHLAPDGTVDMGEVVSGTVQALAPLADEAQVEIESEAASGPALVRGDPQELEQVIQNLVQNAIKYGRPGGRVRIGIERRRDGRVAVSVADDGPGIAPEHLPRLTERFYRVDAPESRNRGGTGLGLAIVKHILNRHRGELVITSELGKGSTFTTILPGKR